MADTNPLNYDDYKQAFQNEFSDFASKFFASPGQGTTDSGKGLIQPPLDLLVLYISEQVNNINNTCTVYMGQEAEGNSTFADYLDGLISGLKSAIPGTGEELPSTSSEQAPASDKAAVTDSYKGVPDTDNKGDYLNFYQSCANFSQLFKPACQVFKNMDTEEGLTYPSPGALCGGKYNVADYKLGTLAVFEKITVNGVQAENPYYCNPKDITVLQYMMYTDWITQVYNGSIPVVKMDSQSAPGVQANWKTTISSHCEADLWGALKVNFGEGAFNPNIASTAVPIITKVDYVLSAFDNVKTVNSVTYQSDLQANPTYTKTVDPGEAGTTIENYAETLLGGSSQASSFKNNTYTLFFDGKQDSNALVSGTGTSGQYQYNPKVVGQPDLYNSLIANQTLSSGIQGSDNTISQMQNTLNSAMEGNTTQNNTLTAARANSQKLAESTLSTAKQMLTTVAGEGDAFVRNQAVR